jgi:3-dehydroquinate dehydratase II
VRVLVLNGVNLNLLGRREADIYGEYTLSELETHIYAWGSQLGLIVLCRQTNNEGQFIDWCHDALDAYDAVIANPGAWTHYSWAIRDALAPYRGPLVEVHLTDVEAREDWRRQSVLSDLASHRIVGKGPDGYKEALEWLSQRQ